MDESGATLLCFAVFLILFFINCIFTGFKSAADHFNSVDLEEMEDEEMKSRIDAMLDEEAALRRSYLLYSTIFFVLTGIFAAKYFIAFTLKGFCFQNMGSRIMASVIAYLILFLLLIVLGVFLPVKLGERKAKHWLTTYIGIVNFMIAILKPFTIPVNAFADLLLPVFRADPKQNVDEIDEDEIISMIDESHEQGMILESEAEMIHNIFEFDDKDAVDIMTPRSNVVALASNMNFEEAVDFMLTENFSRFPVYEEDIDHIIGSVHIKDAMRLSRQKEYLLRELLAVPGLVREIDAVPETQNINQLLRQMQKTKEHMACVVDEYGQISGIVTLEDILEEIVGEIEDEHDEEIAMVLAQSNGNFILNGMASLEEVEEKLGITGPDDDMSTLNGLLISLIDKIPEDNETFEVDYEGYRFKILSVANKMIKTVLATPIAQPADQTIKEER